MDGNIQVTFQSSFFKRIPGEENETNPGRFGKALAQWLADRLRERGVAVEGILPEDFGWVVMIRRQPDMLWIGCGNVDGEENEWTAFPVCEVPFFKRLFSNVNAESEVSALREHLAEIVALVPDVTGVVWE